MQLTSAQKCLIAAALAEKHGVSIGDAIAMADTADRALRVDDPDRVIDLAMGLNN